MICFCYFFDSVFLFVCNRCLHRCFFGFLVSYSPYKVSQRKNLPPCRVQFSAIRNSFLICKKYFIAINIYAGFANKDWLVTLLGGNYSCLLDELLIAVLLFVHRFTMGNTLSKSNFSALQTAYRKLGSFFFFYINL